MPRAARTLALPMRGPRAAAARSRGLVPASPKIAELLEFASHLRVGEGDLVGQPLQLMPWQIDFLGRVFGPRRVRRAILSVARRNGKTGLVAIIVLAALFGPLMVPNSRILSASRSREQAAIVFDYCRKMLQVSGLIHLVHIKNSAKEILCPRFGTVYRAISADATTAVGFGVRLAIHDELGQVRGPRDGLYEALSTAMGSYADSLEILISTQAPTDADLFSLLLDDGLSGTDPSIVAALHAAPADCDLLDVDAWLAANPSVVFGVRDRGDLERMAAEAARMPTRENAFRNYQLNQRVSARSPFISPAVWDACGGPVEEEAFRRGPVHAGLDLSARQDLTALVLAAEGADGLVHLRPHIWTPAATMVDRGQRDRVDYALWSAQGHLEALPGPTIDLEAIAYRLAELCSEYPVERIMFDRWRMAELKRWLEKIGAWHVINVLAEHGQGFRDMTVAVEVMSQLALEEKLRHGRHPVLRWCMSNLEIDRDPAGNAKPDKSEHFGRVDAAVAAMMACRSLRGDVGKPGIEAGQMFFL